MKKLLLLILLALSFVSKGQIIITVAGNGHGGYSGDGGPATSAEITLPGSVIFDANGNFYFCSAYNHIVSKVSHSGIISTFAGNGTSGFSGDGGPATAAELSGPVFIAIDAKGNIYIDDEGNNRIRKVDVLTGMISTVAGKGSFGFSGDGGQATLAEFNYPVGIACDATGNLYIGDHLNFRIRKVDTSGIITTYVGNGTNAYSGDSGSATSAAIGATYGMTCDKSGNLYLTDGGRIHKVDAVTQIITTIAGNGTHGLGDGGTAIAATFFRCLAMSIDSFGAIYIADEYNNRIRKIDTNGIINTVAGNGTAGYSGDGGQALSAEIYDPQGVTIDPCGNLYIADEANNRIRKVIYDTSFSASTPAINVLPANSVCAGTAVTLTADNNVRCGIPSFQWIKNGLNVGANNSTYTDMPANGDSIRCIVTYGTSVSTNTIVMQVAPVDTPKVSITAINPVCSGTAVTFTATHTGGGVAPSYEWIKNGAIVSGAAGPSYTYTPNNGDSVRCLLYASDDDLCAIKPVSSNTIDMTVNPTLKPVVTISGPAVANPGSTVSLIATVTNAGSSYRIEWKNHGIIFSVTTVPNTSYIKTVGLDTITATVIPMAQACFDSTTSSFITVRTGDNAGVANIASATGLDIYPNPANDVLHIDHVTTLGSYTLFNIVGVVVQQGILQSGNNSLSIQTLPQGVYLLEITDEERTIKKIVKQ